MWQSLFIQDAFGLSLTSSAWRTPQAVQDPLYLDSLVRSFVYAGLVASWP